MASPAAEMEIDERLVTALLAEQVPSLAALPVVMAGNGWDNTIARVGEEWMVRLPRRAASAPLIEFEQRWRRPCPSVQECHASTPMGG